MKKVIMIVLLVIAVGVGGFFYWQSNSKKDHAFNYDPGNNFVTDISRSIRLLKTDIIIAMSDDRKTTFYNDNNHRVRNVIINTLRGKTEADFATADIQQALADEIIQRLNKEFTSEDFIKIYFNEFVIQ